MKKISIIVPCYNVEKYIDRCADSLVHQTIGEAALELIFVDDASTDGTWNRLCEWEKNYPESIVLIRCDKNGRQGTARNIGLQHATAEYISFMDSDDWVERDMYEKMLSIITETGVDVVAGLYQREGSDGKIYHEEKAYSGPADQICSVREGEQASLPPSSCCKLYRREIIFDNDLFFPEGLCYEDNYWMVLLSFYVRSFYVIGEVFYHYFVNFDSTVMKRDAVHHMDRLEIERMKLEELKRRGFYEKNRARLDFQFLRYYYINTLHIFFTRFEQLPYELICQMQDTVCQTVPDFAQNPYLDRLNWVEQFFLKTAGMSLSRQEFEEIGAGYRADLRAVEQGKM